MAEAYLNELFDYAKLISDAEEICDLGRQQNQDLFTTQYNNWGQAVWNTGNKQIQTCLKESAVSKDPLFLINQIEKIILPILHGIVSDIASIDIDTEADYVIKSSKSGYLTLYNKKYNRYLHGTDSPMSDARRMISQIYNPAKEHIKVWGIGLGYELYQLWKQSEGSITIDAYEPNPIIYQYARLYGVLDEIPENSINWHIGASINEFASSSNDDDSDYFINLPYLYIIESAEERELLTSLYVQENTYRHLKKIFTTNIYRNIKSGAPLFNNRKPEIFKDEIILVAGGPSVDEAIEEIRLAKGKKTILAVGTIGRKLINCGIVPDAILINDPHELTSHQLDGIYDSDIPLILDVSANWNIARKYTGPKYIVWSGLADRINHSFSLSNNIEYIYPSSKTVTGFATDIAIKSTPKIIHLIGTDFGYPEGKSHATGTPRYKEVSTDGLLPIPSNNGGIVYTDILLNEYRKEMEQRIAAHPDIEFKNRSLTGAAIKGAVPEDSLI